MLINTFTQSMSISLSPYISVSLSLTVNLSLPAPLCPSFSLSFHLSHSVFVSSQPLSFCLHFSPPRPVVLPCSAVQCCVGRHDENSHFYCVPLTSLLALNECGEAWEANAEAPSLTPLTGDLAAFTAQQQAQRRVNGQIAG